jgi:hypothetical protein
MMFAMDHEPRANPLVKGEYLLFQLVKSDAPDSHERIRFALVFDRIVEDFGSQSEVIWGKHWKYLLYGSEVIPTIPFSLPDVPGISKDYAGQTQCLFIEPQDEALVLPYLKIEEEEEPGVRIEKFGAYPILKQLSAYDRIALVRGKPEPVPGTRDQYPRDPWLARTLKDFYRCRCQICETDFKPKYDQPFSQTHHIKALGESGFDVSKNVLVLCPNHHAIIHKTHPDFDRSRLIYTYPNGYEEAVTLKEHLTFVNGDSRS